MNLPLPPPSRTIIMTRALLGGWSVNTRTNPDGSSTVMLSRDDWRIAVTFSGSIPTEVMIQRPGGSAPWELDVNDLSRYLRGHRNRMSAYRIGDRVVVGDRPGLVAAITPEDDLRVRLTVAYDDGTEGQPYTTHVQREGVAA
ncbi:hypothetical protein [Streptosporangium sp. NPDC001681]|uniref:hypothetical protein n=1 Tax=Streptosporangium sp. NPDC001681 TaxID=3154395 RepID=UPI003329AA86